METKNYQALILLFCLCVSTALARPTRLPSPRPASTTVRPGRWVAWAGATLNSTLNSSNGQFGNFNVYPNRRVANLTLSVRCYCESTGSNNLYSMLILREHYTDYIPGTINSRGILTSTWQDSSEILWNDPDTRRAGWVVDTSFDFNRKEVIVTISHEDPEDRCYGTAVMKMKGYGLPYWGSAK